VTVDIVPPAVVTPTLTYRDSTGSYPLAIGQTVRSSQPTLQLDWPASSDGSGLAAYRAGFSTSPLPDPDALTLLSPTATRRVTSRRRRGRRCTRTY